MFCLENDCLLSKKKEMQRVLYFVLHGCALRVHPHVKQGVRPRGENCLMRAEKGSENRLLDRPESGLGFILIKWYSHRCHFKIESTICDPISERVRKRYAVRYRRFNNEKQASTCFRIRWLKYAVWRSFFDIYCFLVKRAKTFNGGSNFGGKDKMIL